MEHLFLFLAVIYAIVILYVLIKIGLIVCRNFIKEEKRKKEIMRQAKEWRYKNGLK